MLLLTLHEVTPFDHAWLLGRADEQRDSVDGQVIGMGKRFLNEKVTIVLIIQDYDGKAEEVWHFFSDGLGGIEVIDQFQMVFIQFVE